MIALVVAAIACGCIAYRRGRSWWSWAALGAGIQVGASLPMGIILMSYDLSIEATVAWVIIGGAATVGIAATTVHLAIQENAAANDEPIVIPKEELGG